MTDATLQHKRDGRLKQLKMPLDFTPGVDG